jgi:hypothetical protein
MAIKHTVVNVQTEEIFVTDEEGTITPPGEGQSARAAGIVSKALAVEKLAQRTTAKAAAKAGLSAAIELIVSTLESVGNSGNEMLEGAQELENQEIESIGPSSIRTALLTLFVSSDILDVSEAEAMGWSAPESQ